MTGNDQFSHQELSSRLLSAGDLIFSFSQSHHRKRANDVLDFPETILL